MAKIAAGFRQFGWATRWLWVVALLVELGLIIGEVV